MVFCWLNGAVGKIGYLLGVGIEPIIHADITDILHPP